MGKPIKRAVNEGCGGEGDLKFGWITLGSLALVAVGRGSFVYLHLAWSTKLEHLSLQLRPLFRQCSFSKCSVCVLCFGGIMVQCCYRVFLLCRSWSQRVNVKMGLEGLELCIAWSWHLITLIFVKCKYWIWTWKKCCDTQDVLLFCELICFHCLFKGKKKVSPDKMVEMQAKIEEERKALETKLDMEEEERNKARAELEKREKDLLKAQWVPCSEQFVWSCGFFLP